MLVVGVVVCLVLSSGQAASLIKLNVQSDYCEWGAQYWCSSVSTADLCGKREWCTNNDWLHDMIQDIPCTVTQQLVKNVRNLIRSSESVSSSLTKFDRALLLGKGCTIFEDDKSRNQCKELVNSEDFLLKMMALVDSDLSTQAIATAIGTCKRNIPAEEPQWRCVDLVSVAQNYISKYMTQDEIDAHLFTVSTFLPKEQQEQYADIIHQYSPFIGNILIQELNPDQICTALGLISNKPEQQQEVAGPVCWICEMIMGQLESILAKNATEHEIEVALEKLCEFLPVLMKPECNAFITQFTPMLVKFLLHHRPQEVCQYLKLCSAEVKGTEIQSPDTNSIECTLCKMVMDKLKSMLGEHATQDKIKAALGKVCHLLPSKFKSKCENFIDKYEPQIIKLLLSAVSPGQICKMLQICATDVEGNEIQSPETKSIECTLCKLVMDELKSMLSEHATQDEIKAALKKVCHLLPPIFESVCEHFIDKYEPQIIQLLLSAISPEQICKRIKICAVYVEGNEIQSPETKSIECTLCKLVMDELKSMLNEHATQDEIKAALKKVCHLLPPIFESVCEHFIDKYEPQIIQLLLSAVSPEQICKRIQICAVDVEGNEIQSPETKSIECTLCKLVMDELKSMLSEHTTQDEIKAALKKVCNLLPSIFESKCEHFIDKYEPQIIQLLLSAVSPEQICKRIQICAVDVEGTEIQSPDTNSIECTLCKLVMDKLKSMVGEHATQDKIKAALGKVCHLLPSKFKSKCEHFIDKYEPQIIKLLLSAVSPGQICKMLQICAADVEDNSVIMAIPLLPVKQKVESGSVCFICEYFVQQLDSILAENKTQQKIEVALGDVCNLLPVHLKQECNDLVAQYVPVITEILLQVSSHKVCQFLRLCSAQSQTEVSENEIQSPTINSIECSMCKMIIDHVKSKLSRNATQDKIEKILEKVCHILPSKLRNKCQKFIEKYEPMLIKLLLSEASSEKICEVIHMCPGNVEDSVQMQYLTFVSENKAEQAAPVQDYCNTCQLALHDFQSVLNNPVWQKTSAATAILYELCNYLVTGQDECRQLVDVNLNDVVNEKTAMQVPIAICQKINFC